MAIALPVYVDSTKPGYGHGQQLPVAGTTPLPEGLTPENEAAVTAWMKQQPWYLQAMQAWKLDPANPHLSTMQRGQLQDAAQRAGLSLGDTHGIGSDGAVENVHTQAGKVIAISIGAGAAGIGALGAAGALGGAGSVGADVGAATTVPELGALGGTASGLGGAGAAGAGIGLGEAGATTGLASGAALPGLEGTLAGTSASMPALGTLPGVTASGGVPAALGTTGTVGGILGNASTLEKIAQLAGLGGTAVSDATKSAGDTQLQKALIGLTANNQNQQAIANANNTNITGNNAFESQLLGRSKDEEVQRANALKDVYRSSYVANPRVSQYDIGGAPQYSDQYRTTVSGLGNQGAGTLGNPAQYATAAQPALKPYQPYTPVPYDPNTMSGPGGTQPSTMQEIGNWLGPTLSTIGAISKIWRR